MAKKGTYLCDRDKWVIAEYFSCDMNKKQAMLNCGYAESTARDRQETVFDKPLVKQEIARRIDKMTQDSEVDEKWLLAQLKEIASAKMGDLLVLDEDGRPYNDYTKLTTAQRAAITGFEVDEYVEGRGDSAVRIKKYKIKTLDRLAAIDKLMRHMGMYNDKLKIEGEMSIVERLQRGRDRVRQQKDERDEGI